MLIKVFVTKFLSAASPLAIIIEMRNLHFNHRKVNKWTSMYTLQTPNLNILIKTVSVYCDLEP